MNRISMEYDVLIVGGGPAGIAAGIWCSEMGMRSAIFERNSEIGGQLLNVFNPIDNYPGVSVRNGAELRDLFVRTLSGRKCKLNVNCEVADFDPASPSIVLTDGHKYTGMAIILATGVRRRRLGVPGEKEFVGKGILASGAKEATTVAGKRVLIAGGGDAAAENALILSKIASTVTIVHRGKVLSARPEFLEQVHSSGNIAILFDTEVQSFEGSDRLTSVTIINKLTNEKNSLQVDHALVRIGFQPNSEPFRPTINCDTSGYILVDSNNQTNSPNVFAVGDVCRPKVQTISTATGDAVTASIAISKLNT